jgi:hypothetical protein
VKATQAAEMKTSEARVAGAESETPQLAPAAVDEKGSEGIDGHNPEEQSEPGEAHVRRLYLRVTDENQNLLGIDTVALEPRRGAVDYREIIIGGEVCTPPEGGTRGGGIRGDAGLRGGRPVQTRYLGNSQNRELHDLENTKTNCRLDRISADHRVNFASEEEAVKAGYDFCAYCFGKKRSKR